MTGRLYRALAVVTTLVSSAAMAQEATSSSVRSGLEFTVGLGFQAGAGYVYKNGPRADGTVGDVKLSDGANGGVAFLLEAGYRASPNWFIGAFGQYTHILTKTNPYSCPEGFDCTTSSIRVGPQVQYHFSPEASFDPFVGIGFGFVTLTSKVEGQSPTPVPGLNADVDIESTFRGPEYVNATVGGKWRLSNSLSFGPYLTGTYARNTVRAGTQTVTLPAQLGGTTATSGVPAVDDGPYGLIILGVRGTFNL
ncbi:outer membrane beta-barrel protein [Pyxidicoccus trucidator]|uniref:outer membrane beta-barrel protein n=1 Tax=Pyxidicoccus trucidator TaxID=2709662 RepID=UPI0013DB06D9|nr:outer membrane beta-barrel protein [Pyxidicoccus trucidator]